MDAMKKKKDEELMSAEDYALSLQYSDGYNKAKAAGDNDSMDYYHGQAEALRKKYGYSGGEDGTGYRQLSTFSQPFSYATAPKYTSKYQEALDKLAGQIMSRPAFEYDYNKDPNYQQYKEVYEREGKQAMNDTLAQVSARTGGLASSYAGATAQQTYDGYMQQLADKVPALRQLAYEMYMDEGNNLRANLSMLQGLESSDYGRHIDSLNQYNTDRSFAYGTHRDGVADDRYTTEWLHGISQEDAARRENAEQKEYDREQDERSWERTDRLDAYNREQDALDRQLAADSTDYNRALAKAETLAAHGDYSGYKALGYSDKEIADMQSTYEASLMLQQRQQSSRKSGGNTPEDEDDKVPKMEDLYYNTIDGNYMLLNDGRWMSLPDVQEGLDSGALKMINAGPNKVSVVVNRTRKNRSGTVDSIN